MEIDVIIPLYKPGKELFTLLDKLGSQSVPVHQVILLNTEEKYFEQLIYGIRFLETYQNVKVYHVSKRWRDQRPGSPHVDSRSGALHDTGCHAER